MLPLRSAAEVAITTSGQAKDCCIYARAWLLKRYGLEPELALGPLWNIWPDDDKTVAPERLYGPVEAAKMRKIDGGGQWWLFQGWRSLQADGRAAPAKGDTGHTFVARDLGDGYWLVIDSTQRTGPRGLFRTEAQIAAEFKAGLERVQLRR